MQAPRHPKGQTDIPKGSILLDAQLRSHQPHLGLCGTLVPSPTSPCLHRCPFCLALWWFARRCSRRARVCALPRKRQGLIDLAGVIKRASQAPPERQQHGNHWQSGHGGVLSATWHPACGDAALGSQHGDSHLGACHPCPSNGVKDHGGGCEPAGLLQTTLCSLFSRYC